MVEQAMVEDATVFHNDDLEQEAVVVIEAGAAVAAQDTLEAVEVMDADEVAQDKNVVASVGMEADMAAVA